MAKAKKLPSGNWRVNLYDYTDPATGKRIYKSFTATTRKRHLVTMIQSPFSRPLSPLYKQ